MRGGCATPVYDYVKGEEKTAQRIHPPYVEEVADEGEDDGEGVEDDVGHGVLSEGLDGGVAD